MHLIFVVCHVNGILFVWDLDDLVGKEVCFYTCRKKLWETKGNVLMRDYYLGHLLI